MKIKLIPTWSVANLQRIIEGSPELVNLALLEHESVKKRTSPREGQRVGTLKIEVEIMFSEKDGVKEYAAGICKVSEEIHKSAGKNYRRCKEL